MENNEQNRQPVIDVDYINKLLTTYSPKAEEPAPKAEEPVKTAPDTEAPAPKAKRLKAPLLVLAVIALLGVGFLLGRMLKIAPDNPPEVTTSSAPTSTTAPDGTTAPPETEPGILEEELSVTTYELLPKALVIDKLIEYGSPQYRNPMSVNAYDALRQAYPVLGELEKRTDAPALLKNVIASAPDTDAAYAATALLRYYVDRLGIPADLYQPLPSCEWIVSSSSYYAVYEYTQAPTFYTTPQTADGAKAQILLRFDNRIFEIDEVPEILSQECNFWLRISFNREMPDLNFDNSTIDGVPLSALESSGLRVSFIPYGDKEGFFIFGYTEETIDCQLSMRDSSTTIVSRFNIKPPLAADVPTPELVAQLAARVMDIQTAVWRNSHRDVSLYPPLAALFAREDGIAQLLDVVKKTRFPQSELYFRTDILTLLTMPCVQERMTEEQLQILKTLLNGGFIDSGSADRQPLLTPPNGISISDFENHRLGDTPETLKDIPMEEMNVWIYVPVVATDLWQPDWTLEAALADGSAEGTLGVWQLYTETDTLRGWVVSGKLSEATPILLRLKQGDTTLELHEITPTILDTPVGA